MGELKTSTEGILVHLVRPGIDVQDYYLAEGATLADLLRRAGASGTDQSVLIDGLAFDEFIPLGAGAVVTIAPRLGNAPVREPWRATISAFRDDLLFQEYSDTLKALRDEDEPEDGQGG